MRKRLCYGKDVARFETRLSSGCCKMATQEQIALISASADQAWSQPISLEQELLQRLAA